MRLQLVHESSIRKLSNQRREREGVYRVVQVPTNYTFRHLHKLILFLFASDIQHCHLAKAAPIFARLQQSSSKLPATLSNKVAGKARETSGATASQSWGGHYFEVQKQVALYPESKKPGVIKPGGKTWAKLSSIRERRLFRDLTNPHADVVAPLPPTLEDEDVDKEEWTWEAEDDFTLAHVWPKGPTLDKGIIYVSDFQVQPVRRQY